MDDHQPPVPDQHPSLDLDEAPEPEPTGDPVRDRVSRLRLRDLARLAEEEGPEGDAAREVLRPANEALKQIRERTLSQLVDSVNMKGALANAQHSVDAATKLRDGMMRGAAGGSVMDAWRGTGVLAEALSSSDAMTKLRGELWSGAAGGSVMDTLRGTGVLAEALGSGGVSDAMTKLRGELWSGAAGGSVMDTLRGTGVLAEALRSGGVSDALRPGGILEQMSRVGAGAETAAGLGVMHERLLKGAVTPEETPTAFSEAFLSSAATGGVLDFDVELEEPLELDLEALGAPARRQTELLDAVVHGLEALLAVQQQQAVDAADARRAQAVETADARREQAHDARVMRRLGWGTLAAAIAAVVVSLVTPFITPLINR